MEIKLNQSKVVFNEKEHTYFLGDKQLQGITGLIQRQLYPHEYAGVSEEVLNAKADFGHNIHGQIELYDSGIALENEYITHYRAIKEVYGLTTLANEYLIDDGENFASAIDLVMNRDDDGVWLVDIKTTYSFAKDKVAWQLSIYRYMFELLNPNIKVKGIAGLWFKVRKGELEDVSFIDLTAQLHSIEDVKKLLECEVNGLQFVDTTHTEIVVPSDVVDEICRIENTIKSLADKENELRAGLLKLMQDNDVKSFKNDRLLLTRKLATTTKRFDSTRFKKEHKDLYEEYLKESTTGEALVIKVYDDSETM